MTLAPFTYKMPNGLSRPCAAVLTGDAHLGQDSAAAGSAGLWPAGLLFAEAELAHYCNPGS